MRRPPDDADLAALIGALARHGVEYALIGGTAMALYGFPHATKNIDLLLPVDPANNARLLQALASLPGTGSAAEALQQVWLDQGFSTAVEADIVIDLLFVAAGRSFEALRKHVRVVDFGGQPAATLDLDGLIATKLTDRDSDAADRARLTQLKHALDRKRATDQDAK